MKQLIDVPKVKAKGLILKEDLMERAKEIVIEVYQSSKINTNLISIGRKTEHIIVDCHKLHNNNKVVVN